MIRCPVSYLRHDVIETGFCLRSQLEPTQLGPVDRARPHLGKEGLALLLRSIGYVSLENEDRIQSPKRHVLNKRQDD
jgi:hypothetical protein